MDETKQSRLTSAISRAIRAGRDQRRKDLAQTGEDIREELSAYRGKGMLEHEQHIAPLLDNASARRFLSHVDIEDRYGKETRVEVADAKLREKYEKRPSVRGLKKAKTKDAGGPSI